jgi:hypothetical protein
MSFVLRYQATWPCTICGRECDWDQAAHEILHQETRSWQRFVCERCVAAGIRATQGPATSGTPGGRATDARQDGRNAVRIGAGPAGVGDPLRHTA